MLGGSKQRYSINLTSLSMGEVGKLVARNYYFQFDVWNKSRTATCRGQKFEWKIMLSVLPKVTEWEGIGDEMTKGGKCRKREVSKHNITSLLMKSEAQSLDFQIGKGATQKLKSRLNSI